MAWPWERADEIFNAWREWTRTVPDDITSLCRMLQVPSLPDVPPALRGRKLIVVEAAILGDPDMLAPLRALEPELDTFATVPAPSLVRLHQDPEEPMPGTSESALIEELPRAAIEALLELAGPSSGSPLGMVELRQVGGALGRVTPGHGALAKLDAKFVLFAAGLAIDADMEAEMLSHATRIVPRLAPWAATGHYLNFAEHAVDTSHSYGAFTYRRLQAVKARVDPGNVIHANHAL
jgi:hypothetical protein